MMNYTPSASQNPRQDDYVLLLEEENKLLKKQNKNLEERREALQEQVLLLKRALYGKSSEKRSLTEEGPEQLKLALVFNEIYKEKGAEGESVVEAEAEAESDGEENESQIAAKQTPPKRGGRKPLPKTFEREIIIHELPLRERTCAYCQGEMTKIGDVTKERLRIIPQKTIVEEHVRYKYACRKCEENGVKIAPPIKEVIPKSMATPSLLADVLIKKYADHLPLYRQSDIWWRQGAYLSRALMSSWVLKCGELLNPIREAMEQEIKEESPYIQIDETPVEVLQSVIKKNKKEKGPPKGAAASDIPSHLPRHQTRGGS